MPEGKAEESQGQSRAAEGRGQGRAGQGRAGQGRAAGERDSAQGRGRQGRAGGVVLCCMAVEAGWRIGRPGAMGCRWAASALKFLFFGFGV